MPQRAKSVNYRFPKSGLVESASLSEQPRDTTPVAVNVVAHDPRTGKSRGASRSGLSKYCPQIIDPSANPFASPKETRAIQDLQIVVGYRSATDEYILLEDGSGGLLLEDGSGDVILLEGDYDTHVGDRDIVLVAVANGTAKKVTTAGTDTITNGSAALSKRKNVVFSTVFGQNIYYCDGTNYAVYDGATNAISTWTATAPGVLPVDGDGNKAELICTQGGRIWLAGLRSDPRTWFASAVEAPLDWDYSPDVITEAIAVAGNSSMVGQPADIITSLIPYSDDTLMIGGDQTIWVMRGNPAGGGSLDLVTTATGVAYGRSWCRSPDGMIYFMGGRGGLYRISPEGNVPQRVSANVIDERLADLAMEDHQVSLAWDDRNIGVRVFITRKPVSGVAQPSDGHLFWDLRNNAWWVVRFRNAEHNPLCVLEFDGPDPQDKCVLLGCQDGYIRRLDVDAVTDDGEPIESEVWLGPFENMNLLDMQMVLSEESGGLNWSLHHASTLDGALVASGSASGRWRGGSNRSCWPKRYIQSGYIKLASQEPWAMESLKLVVAADSEHRDRVE